MTFVVSLLNALVAIPKIADLVMSIVETISNWYIAKADVETNKLILDAASLAVKAHNKEDRDKALDAWKIALSRTRYIK